MNRGLELVAGLEAEVAACRAITLEAAATAPIRDPRSNGDDPGTKQRRRGSRWGPRPSAEAVRPACSSPGPCSRAPEPRGAALPTACVAGAARRAATRRSDDEQIATPTSRICRAVRQDERRPAETRSNQAQALTEQEPCYRWRQPGLKGASLRSRVPAPALDPRPLLGRPASDPRARGSRRGAVAWRGTPTREGPALPGTTRRSTGSRPRCIAAPCSSGCRRRGGSTGGRAPGVR